MLAFVRRWLRFLRLVNLRLYLLVLFRVRVGLHRLVGPGLPCFSFSWLFGFSDKIRGSFSAIVSAYQLVFFEAIRSSARTAVIGTT